MKIVNCGKEEYSWKNITEYDKTEIPDNITCIYYIYDSGGYEGYGQMLLQHENGKWYHHNMGHCSCYGPLDNLDKLNCVEPQPFDELLARMTEELREECSVLVKAISKV